MGILVLGAGMATRSPGGEDGRQILQRTLSHACAADFPVVTILGPAEIELADELQASFPDAQILRYQKAPLGLGYSLSFGADQARDLGWSTCLILPGDVAGVASRTLNAVGKRLRSDNIIVPRYQQRPGHPLGFGSAFFDQLARLTGNDDPAPIWQRHAERVEYLELDDRAILERLSSAAGLPQDD